LSLKIISETVDVYIKIPRKTASGLRRHLPVEQNGAVHAGSHCLAGQRVDKKSSKHLYMCYIDWKAMVL
jgi:hypothetical protein